MDSPVLDDHVPHWTPRKNWAGNLSYSTNQLYLPTSIEEVQEIVRRAQKVRPLGSTHCFNAIADSTVSQVSVANLVADIQLDTKRMEVTVGGGVRYGALATFLNSHGYALHNLASLPHISVVGACATATHGSGVNNGNLATAVTAIEFIDASGELVTLRKDAEDDQFAGAVVGLGCLGVVTRVTLTVEPAFEVAQHVYLNMPMEIMVAQLDAIMASGYSVSLFTDWKNQTHNQLWLKRKEDKAERLVAEAEFFGGQLANRDVHPVLRLPAESCTTQQGVPGPWHERLPHFKVAYTPSSGKELQTEYFVSRELAGEVMQIYMGFADMLAPILMVSEIRTVAEDDLWMSTAYGKDMVAFHCTWEQDWESLQRLLPEIEAALRPYSVRPHWGKNFLMGRKDLDKRFERIDDFRNLVSDYDANGKFRNAFIEQKLFGA